MQPARRQPARRRIEIDDEEPGGERSYRWLAGGIGLLATGICVWLLFGSGDGVATSGSAVLSHAAEATDSVGGAGAFALTRASWGSVQPEPEKLEPPPPPAEMTDEQRRVIEFADEAKRRWKGTEVFMRPR